MSAPLYIADNLVRISRGGRLFSEQSLPAQRLRQVLAALGAEYGVSATTIVYAWLLQHPSNPVVLTGSGRIAAIKEAVLATGDTCTRTLVCHLVCVDWHVRAIIFGKIGNFFRILSKYSILWIVIKH